jgi:hypothetical protein
VFVGLSNIGSGLRKALSCSDVVKSTVSLSSDDAALACVGVITGPFMGELGGVSPGIGGGDPIGIDGE